MRRRAFVHDVARVAFAVVCAVAIAYQFGLLQSHPSFSAGNFFSFFTIQSNVLAATMLVLVALVRRDERTRWFDVARGAVALYIAITGVVFALLLSGLQEELDTHNGFVNFVVHTLVPVVVIVDWLVDPPRHRVGAKLALAWLLYPLAWFAYTLIRGEAVGWYPYPFVDVDRLGYDGVLLRSIAFLVAFAAAALAFGALGDRRASRASGDV